MDDVENVDTCTYPQPSEDHAQGSSSITVNGNYYLDKSMRVIASDPKAPYLPNTCAHLSIT